MKKLLLLLVAIVTLQLAVSAEDSKPIKFEQLPAKAQEFVKKYFTNKKISLTKMENEILDKDFSVIFSDGCKVDFTKSGDWKEIECKTAALPKGIVPAQISDYVTKNYPEIKITKIEKDKKYYEVKLSNKMELKFDMKFNLVDLDN